MVAGSGYRQVFSFSHFYGGLIALQDTEDEKAHILCNDGHISTIPKGGKAKTMAAAASGESGFIVYV